MTPTFTHTDPLPGKPAAEFSVGQRQMAALGFIAFLLLGFVATMAYVAGRVAHAPAPLVGATPTARPRLQLAAPSAAVKAPSVEIERKKPAVEQLIVVEAAAPDPVVTTKPADPLPGLVPGKAPELKPVAPEFLAGNTFWQVAATERGMAEVTCEFLARRGLPAVLGDSPSPGIFRVLVGPIRTPDETGRHKVVLDAAGFHPFIKKY